MIEKSHHIKAGIKQGDGNLYQEMITQVKNAAIIVRTLKDII